MFNMFEMSKTQSIRNNLLERIPKKFHDYIKIIDEIETMKHKLYKEYAKIIYPNYARCDRLTDTEFHTYIPEYVRSLINDEASIIHDYNLKLYVLEPSNYIYYMSNKLHVECESK